MKGTNEKNLFGWCHKFKTKVGVRHLKKKIQCRIIADSKISMKKVKEIGSKRLPPQLPLVFIRNDPAIDTVLRTAFSTYGRGMLMNIRGFMVCFMIITFLLSTHQMSVEYNQAGRRGFAAKVHTDPVIYQEGNFDFRSKL